MEFVEDIIDKKYSVSTKSNYNRRQNRFRKWLEIFHKEDCFIEDIIDFSTIAANILHKYIGEEAVFKEGTKKAGQIKCHSDVEGNHAALCQLFVINNTELPDGFSTVLINIFSKILIIFFLLTYIEEMERLQFRL